MKAPLRTLAAILVLCGSAVFYNAGCSTTPLRANTDESVDDAAITQKVKAALVKDPLVKTLDVKVNTHDGNVQLSGFVDTPGEKALVEQIVQRVDGVVEVQNALALKVEPAR